MTLVCFDSNFVIWGIKRQATPGQETNVAKATYLLKQLAEQHRRILIPTIALGEVLASLPDSQHWRFVRQVQRSCVLAGFDTAAATQFARLWRSRERDGAYTRSETKADYLIAAIAMANGCEVIYSGDAGLRRFAASVISVISIDEIATPPQ